MIFPKVTIGMLFIANISLANTLVPEPQPLAEQAFQENIQVSDLNTALHDEEILQSMDNLGDQLDLIELDKQQQFLSSEETIREDTLPAVDNSFGRNELELIEEELIGEEFFIDDGFDDLDIDAELFDDVDILQTLPNQFPQHFLKNSKKLNKKSAIGVGVKGDEEQIINQLDNSHLIDVEAELNIWLEDIEITPAKQGEMDDIE